MAAKLAPPSTPPEVSAPAAGSFVSIASEFQLSEQAGIVRATVRSAVPSRSRPGTAHGHAQRPLGLRAAHAETDGVIGGAVVSMDHQVIDGTSPWSSGAFGVSSSRRGSTVNG